MEAFPESEYGLEISVERTIIYIYTSLALTSSQLTPPDTCWPPAKPLPAGSGPQSKLGDKASHQCQARAQRAEEPQGGRGGTEEQGGGRGGGDEGGGGVEEVV